MKNTELIIKNGKIIMINNLLAVIYADKYTRYQLF